MQRDPRLDDLSRRIGDSLEQHAFVALADEAETRNGAARFMVSIGASTDEPAAWSMALIGFVDAAVQACERHDCKCFACAATHARLSAVQVMLRGASDMAQARAAGRH